MSMPVCPFLWLYTLIRQSSVLLAIPLVRAMNLSVLPVTDTQTSALSSRWLSPGLLSGGESAPTTILCLNMLTSNVESLAEVSESILLYGRRKAFLHEDGNRDYDSMKLSSRLHVSLCPHCTCLSP